MDSDNLRSVLKFLMKPFALPTRDVYWVFILVICDKLHQMKLIDRSYHMDEFEFMRSHYQKALYNLLTVAKSTRASRDNNSGALCPKMPSLQIDLELASSRILEWSRYANEFVEMHFIAKGGFGQVFKARHKLDGNVYAIKKIHLRYQNASGFLRSLREVKMLACLNHPNIVAYKAAWLEPFDSRRTESNQVTAVIVDENSTTSSSQEEYSQEESSDIIFEKSKSKSSDYRNKPNSRNDSSEINNGSLALCKFRHSLGRLHAWNVIQTSARCRDWATLFVQMQLCEDNMRQWLDKRNHSSVPLNIEQSLSMFIKILRGIEYIHDKGIVHHDIKPSNIFVSEDLRQVQVGDFGLACYLHKHTTVPLVQQESVEQPEHTGRIGTKLYAAPEQIIGECSDKSDIYSVGIILLELLVPFQTEMERSKVISRLKHGHIPAEITANWPELARIISQTVCVSSSSKRPSASELLKCFQKSSSPNVKCDKDKIIQQLQRELAAKDEEITRLRRQLAELSVNAKTEVKYL